MAGAIAGIADIDKKIPGISVYAGAIAGAMFAGKYAIKKYPIMESTEFLIIG